MLNQLWNAVVQDLATSLEPEDIGIWIKPLKPKNGSGQSDLVLLCPNQTHRRWVQDNYGHHLERALGHLDPARKLRLEVDSAKKAARPALAQPRQMRLPRIFDRPPPAQSTLHIQQLHLRRLQ